MREYKKMIKNAFCFQGRARRREYWVVVLINSAISCFLYAVMFLACTAAGNPLAYAGGADSAYSAGFDTAGSTVGTIMAIPIGLFAVYCGVSIIGLTVRRYHDAGFPGWLFPVCLLGCCLCGIGAIAHLVFTLLPSKEDNQYGVNPKAPENNEYEGSRSIGVSVTLCICSLILLLGSVVLNVRICGLKEDDSSETSDNEIIMTNEAETDIPTDNDMEEYRETEEYTDIETEEEEPDTDTVADNTYDLVIGDTTYQFTLPDGADNVYSAEYMLSYECENVDIEYSDSFWDITEDALEQLNEQYAVYSDVEELNISESMAPEKIELGNGDAYYFKVVTTYEDGENFVYYVVWLDVGAENYMEVTVGGASDEITDEDVFEIADI